MTEAPADQGHHDFDLILRPNGVSEIQELAFLARAMMMPPIASDITG